MKRFAALLLALTMVLSLSTACGGQEDTTPSATKDTTTTTTAPQPTVPPFTIDPLPDEGTPTDATINQVNLGDYTIVYDQESPDYTARAAVYIRDQIYARTGAALPVVTDEVDPAAHEIVVGETNRPISASLNEDTQGLQFSLLAQDGHVAMEGDYFVIAAAAYYFVTTYVTDGAATVPATAQVLHPITKKATNYILLIGDGMGLVHTQLPAYVDGGTLTDYSDGENLFYGSMLPYFGFAHTNSLEGTTDSAASATALASGHKTNNGFVGRNKDGQDLLSLTELAGSLHMGTAVMSTEVQTGATIAGFTAHADDRDLTDDILASQQVLQDTYGTIIDGDHDDYTAYGVYQLEQAIRNHLNTLSQNENGFFMMYEEAYIDKHSHDLDLEKTAQAVLRFNQAIGVFMEFVFYNPNTVLLITADHETGGLYRTSEGEIKYNSGGHTGRDVPVYGYGYGAELFHDRSVENVQIAKTIAALWGQRIAQESDEQYPPLC